MKNRRRINEFYGKPRRHNFSFERVFNPQKSGETIEVETYADVDGRNVTLSLVSAGANEAIEEYKNKVIDEQLDSIRKIAPDIVIIEV